MTIDIGDPTNELNYGVIEIDLNDLHNKSEQRQGCNNPERPADEDDGNIHLISQERTQRGIQFFTYSSRTALSRTASIE